MEEQISVQKIILKFNSIEINRLKVSLYNQKDQLFQICTLLQNRKHQIQLSTKLPYIYCVINTTNKTQDFSFQIQANQADQSNLIEKEIQFDQFILEVQIHTKKVLRHFSQNQNSQLLAETANLELAKSCLSKIRQKVLFTLTKENFIRSHKRKSKLLTKAKVRRSKSKKNLTAVFYRNQNHEIVMHQFKKQLQRSEIDLNSEQKDAKSNQQPIRQYSKPANAPKSSFRCQHQLHSFEKQGFQVKQQDMEQKKITESKITEKNETNAQKSQKSWCIRYCNGKSKNKYLRTLQNETLKQLNNQKQQLEFLRGLASCDKTPLIRVQTAKENVVQSRAKELISAYRVVSRAKVSGKVKKQIK